MEKSKMYGRHLAGGLKLRPPEQEDGVGWSEEEWRK